jgi:Protein of unknown function (DUF3606)
MPENIMADGEPDRGRISLRQRDELEYWTKRFGVSREHLEEALHVVGNRVEDVEQYLRGKASP